MLHDVVGALIVGITVRVIVSHAEQFEHGAENKQNLGSVDQTVSIDVVDVESVAKFILQRCFRGRHVGNEELEGREIDSGLFQRRLR